MIVATSSNRAEVEDHAGDRSLLDVVVCVGSRSLVADPFIQAEHSEGGDSLLDVITVEGSKGSYGEPPL